MIGKRKTPPLTQEQLLALKPARLVSPALQPRDNGGGALKVPLPQRRWPFKLPAGATKTFELDAIGVFVWNALDGETTVQQLIEKLAAEYRLNLREAQVPTLKFLETLMRKGLIGLPRNESPNNADPAAVV
jgi:hypothetical protein